MKIICLLFLIMFFQSGLPELQKKKLDIDQYLIRHKKEVICYVKVPHKKDLLKVKNNKWPDEVEYTYDIYKDQSGKVVFIAQIPFSESGDWNIVYKHYFDEKGKTFAFIKEESIFNDNIKGGVVRELLLNYYGSDFKLINRINNLTDKDYHPLKKDKNQFDFPEYKYSVYKNADECLKAYNVKL